MNFEFLNNMTIKAKMMILVMIPLILALVFGSIYTASAYKAEAEMAKLSALINMGAKMSALVHESQKERGMTAGYIGSKGAKFAAKLPEQRKLFDAKRVILLAELKRINPDYFDQIIETSIQKVLKHLAKTDVLRQGVTSLSIPLGKALGHYTSLNAHFIHIIERIRHLSHNAEMSGDLVAYSNFLQSKERAGIERAVLTNTFANDKFSPGFYKKFVSLVAAQDSYMHAFFANVTPSSRGFYEATMNISAVGDVAAMRKIADAKFATGHFGVDSGVWFATMTQKINALKAVETHLTEEIIKTADGIYADEFFNFISALVGLILGLLLVILLSMTISRRIHTSVAALESTMKTISDTGNLSTQAPVIGSDEFAEISENYNRFTASIKNIVDDSNAVLSKVANGDFSSRMTGNANGDFDTLKQGVNGSAESVDFMVSQLSNVMDGMSNGDFSIRMDEKVPASFRSKVDTTLKTIGNALTEINTVMNGMSVGNYSSRVTANVPGELNVMKVAINTALNKLETGMTEVITVMEAQASGNLNKNITGAYDGGLDDLKKAINKSIANMHTAITQVKLTAETVNDSSGEIAASSETLSDRVQEQAAALEETASAMEEITSTVANSTSLAEQAASLSNKTKASASEGVKVMDDTVQAMGRITEVSKSINEIISLIDNIAFQTNLLALNAAVEAARAGDHGRGFAVVAGEVRNLAGRSADAARDIKVLIERTTMEVSTGTELVQRSGVMLNEINVQVDDVSGMVDEITSALREQNIGVGQINQAITTLDHGTQENAAMVEETASSASQMANESEALHRVVAGFKV